MSETKANEKNATIESTMLGTEDHGCMSFWLYLDYGGAGQGFGGYALDEPGDKEQRPFRRHGTAFGLEAIMEVLRVTGVPQWEKLPGTPIRVRGERLGVGSGPLSAIGHYLKDEWLNLDELAARYKPEAAS